MRLILTVSPKKPFYLALPKKSFFKPTFTRLAPTLTRKMSTDETPSKRQKLSTTAESSHPYELIYWPSIPGRGEFVRLAFEATSTPYIDVSNTQKHSPKAVIAQISPSNHGDATNPPPLAPPILRHGDLLLSQTPNILLYLGPRLGLVPDASEDEAGQYHINSLTLTVLDGLSNEAHDTHHPVSTGAYYDEQKDEAWRAAQDYCSVRLPRYLAYFERVLSGPASSGGEWLYGGKLSYADLVLFQGIDGVSHAFPKRMARMREEGKYDKVFALYQRVKQMDSVKAYLESERRQKYGNGIWRYYSELDME